MTHWHSECLGAGQRKILAQLAPFMRQWGFYLAGGTAIALHLGHRVSIDLDWFTDRAVANPANLAADIKEAGLPFVIKQIDKGTLHGSLNKVRVSFLEYRYPLLRKPLLAREYGCPIASLDDLACMKLSAVAQRGSRKDFLDIYALGLKHLSLKAMLRLYSRRYAVKDVGHVLYGLAYFDDAERENMPRMLWKVSWQEIKKTIQGWVRATTGLSS